MRAKTFAALSTDANSNLLALLKRLPLVVLFLLANPCLILILPMSSKPKAREAELNFEGDGPARKNCRADGVGKLPLEDLIVRYEEGMSLVKVVRTAC